MRVVLINIVRCILFVLAQGLIFGQIDFGYGIHTMIYPLFILLLPFEVPTVALMLIAFVTGIGVDFFMNTFGLHASAAVLVAYIRPFVYQRMAPRDGYEIGKEPSINGLGYVWFLKVSSIIVFVHHLWFFMLEYFKWSAWEQILFNTIVTSVITLLIFILIQIIFFKRTEVR